MDDDRPAMDDLLTRFSERMAARAPIEESPRPPSQIQRLEQQLKESEGRVREAELARRDAQAEIERAKVRLARDADRQMATFRSDFIAGFLDVLDDVDRAVMAASEVGAAQPLRDGLELLRRRFLGKLSEHGVEPMEAEGEPFDPRRHEAVSLVVVQSPADDGRVIHVAAPGYVSGEEVLRPARVVVGRQG